MSAVLAVAAVYATYSAFQSTAERVNDDEEQPASTINRLGVCQICHDDPAILTCSDETHAFCAECFSQYAMICFQIGGSYVQRVEQAVGNTRHALISEAGCLPCPNFQHGDCSCHAFSMQTFRQHLSEEAFRQWQAAVRRMAVAEAERLEHENPREPQDGNDILSHVQTAVAEVLSIGSAMLCPRCHRRAIKDDQCMHVQCGGCLCEWCYCCGQERPPNRGCPTCEVNHGIFLESHPGFGGRELNDETSGDGALHEFHRRRMAYFVRLVKIVVDERDANLWNQFRQANPTILDDVPTSGREIAWEDVDDAQAPTFGNTRLDALQWRTYVDPHIDALRNQLDEYREEEEEMPGHAPDQDASSVNEELLQLLEQLLIQQEHGEILENGDDLINEILQNMAQEEEPVVPHRRRRRSLFRRFRRRRRPRLDVGYEMLHEI